MRLFKRLCLGAALAVGLVVIACSESNMKEKFYAIPAERPVAEVTFKEYPNFKEASKVIGDTRLGMAVWNNVDNSCTVHFVAGDFTTLGHEVYHCYKGAFHDE